MIKFDGKLLLIGAGKMGSAMLAGWIEGGLLPEQVAVIEPFLSSEQADFLKKCAVDVVQPQDITQAPAVIVLAVKPQIMAEVVASLKDVIGAKTLLISIAAGQNLSTLEGYLETKNPIIRIMPNTPASIGAGMSVACGNDLMNAAQKSLCSVLMSTVGEVAWIDDESLMDAVTAVSGSGPAYVFLLAEVMAAAGEKAGLSPELSRQLADQTVSGAGALLQASDEDAATLRKNVTSPRGTTEAALHVLMNDVDGMALVMERAVQAAVKRSKELS